MTGRLVQCLSALLGMHQARTIRNPTLEAPMAPRCASSQNRLMAPMLDWNTPGIRKSGNMAHAVTKLWTIRQFLEPIKQKHPWISYADLWTLAGVTSLEALGGPKVQWRPGRTDKDPKKVTVKDVPPNGRLPDAALGAQHIRDVFYRMGFNDQEIVALSGAHALGRCHTDRSGFSGRK